MNGDAVDEDEAIDVEDVANPPWKNDRVDDVGGPSEEMPRGRR